MNVPREVLFWEKSKRVEYSEKLEKGTTKMFHARGMIVGCEEAGKTTLLGRLHRTRGASVNKVVEKTFGIKVHDDIFEIKGESLVGKISFYSIWKKYVMNALTFYMCLFSV